jgi:hypothetical protein
VYHDEVDRGSAPPRSAASCPLPAGAARSRNHPWLWPSASLAWAAARLGRPDARRRRADAREQWLHPGGEDPSPPRRGHPPRPAAPPGATTHTPEARQRWKRLDPVPTGSKRAGRSCQGAPVRKIHGMPLTMRRCGAFGRPVQGFSFGRCAAKRRHRASGKSPSPTRSVWDRGPESSVVGRGALRRCGRAGPGCGRGPPLLPLVAVRAAKLRRTRENPAIRKKPTIREKRGRGEGLQAWSRVTSPIPGRDRLRPGERP